MDKRKQIAEIITQTHKTPLEQADEIMLLFNVVDKSEQLCDHPIDKRASFKSHGKDFCWKCGKHI